MLEDLDSQGNTKTIDYAHFLKTNADDVMTQSTTPAAASSDGLKFKEEGSTAQQITMYQKRRLNEIIKEELTRLSKRVAAQIDAEAKKMKRNLTLELGVPKKSKEINKITINTFLRCLKAMGYSITVISTAPLFKSEAWIKCRIEFPTTTS